jgi:hypothetical protein
MANDKIDQILEARKKPDSPDGDKFFSIPAIGTTQENFLELRFKTGLRTAFSFNDLAWFNEDPEAGFIDMEFNGYLISVKGRGLNALFTGIKNKQVAWIREADSEFQDHKDNDHYVEEIIITPPKAGDDADGGKTS